jgi:hypothetical protein
VIGLRGWAWTAAVAGIAVIGVVSVTGRTPTDAPGIGSVARPQPPASQRPGLPAAPEKESGPAALSATEPSIAPTPRVFDSAAATPTAPPEQKVGTAPRAARSKLRRRASTEESVDAATATAAGEVIQADESSTADVEHRADPMFKHQF